MNQHASSPKPPRQEAAKTVASTRLGYALRVGLREIWDRLGLVIAISLTWTILLALPLTLGRLLPLAVPVSLRNLLVLLTATLTLSAPTAGVYYIAHLVCIHDEVSYLDFWHGAKRYFAPATRLGLVAALVFSVFVVNIWFYLQLRSGGGLLAALACLYALLFWLMMAVYHFPLLVAQEQGLFDEPERQAKRGVFAVLRRAFYLALGDPFTTLGLLAALVLLSIPVFLTLALPPMLWPASLALLTTQATRALLRKYGVLPLPVVEEAVPDEKFRIKTQ